MRQTINVFCLIISVAIFILWMKVVGNPHVVETILGLIISIGTGTWVYQKLNKLFRKESTKEDAK